MNWSKCGTVNAAYPCSGVYSNPIAINDLTLSARGDALLPNLASVTIRTLAMAGGASFPWAVPGAEKLAATVPNGRAQRLPGQSHGPADDVVAAALGEFFVEGDV